MNQSNGTTNHPTNEERRIAIFGDVHGNIHALDACLAHMQKQKVTRFLCLGDLVGYGAFPVDCLRRVASLHGIILQGNHDEAAASEISLAEYSDGARAGVEFSRRKLTAVWRGLLGNLPLVYLDESFSACHAAPFAPALWPYVLDESVAALSLRSQPRPICFIGHTHRPAIWSISAKGALLSPPETQQLPAGRRFLINVGSIGQPRDDDWRASYAIFEPATRRLEFHRVAYEIAKAQSAILRAGLPPALADRLEDGR